MRSESSAICTSGDPVSPGLRANFETTSALRSAARAISIFPFFLAFEVPESPRISPASQSNGRSISSRARHFGEFRRVEDAERADDVPRLPFGHGQQRARRIQDQEPGRWNDWGGIGG